MGEVGLKTSKTANQIFPDGQNTIINNTNDTITNNTNDTITNDTITEVPDAPLQSLNTSLTEAMNLGEHGELEPQVNVVPWDGSRYHRGQGKNPSKIKNMGTVLPV